MSDLLNYSIMHPRSPVSSNVSSFSSPKMSHNAPPQNTVLPPINTLMQSASVSSQQLEHSPASHIKLPPISPSNYTLTRPGLPSSISVCSYSAGGCSQLTESNLSHFQSNRDSHGLGLLSSAIFLEQQQQQQQQKQQHQLQPSSRSSSVPSLASSASSITSYLSSPATPELVHANIQNQQPTPVATPKSTSISSSNKPASSSSSSTTNKRRQRLGPSCDSCRARKVKCNAEIAILSPSTTSLASTYNLTSQQLDTLSTTHKLCMGNFQLLYVNEKYIQFKPCNSCVGKKIDCRFSNGFTKEDILSNKKKLKKSSSAGKVTKEATKKFGSKNASGVCLDKLLNCGALTEAQVGITA